MSENRIGLLGAGRQALETAGYCREEGFQPVFYVEEIAPDYDRKGSEFEGEILGFDQDLGALADLPVLCSVGLPDTRRRLIERWPGRSYVTVISRRAWVATDCAIGEGCLVAPMAVVNRLCRLGDHVLVNVGATVSHDVTVGDFSTVSPGCNIGGCVSIGTQVFLGIGSTVRDRVSIGDGSFIAAGAVVVCDVEEGQTVMGVPAKPREPRDPSW